MSTLGQWLRSQGFTVDDNPVQGRSATWTGVRTIMVHHDAGNEAPSAEAGAARFARTGTDIAPLYQLLVGVSGRVWVIARQRSGQAEPGRASHAGTGGPTFGMPRDRANEMSLGVAMQCNGSHPLSTHRDAYAVMVRLLAALCRRYGLTEANILGHKEWTPRKIDPRDNMNTIRADVRRALAPPPPPPAPEPPTIEGMPDMFMYLSAISGRAIMVTGGRQVFAEATTANNALRPMAGDPPLYFRASADWERRMVAAFGPIVDTGAAGLSVEAASGPQPDED